MRGRNPYPKALIALTKGILATGFTDHRRLAADFKFVAPVVGPLTKDKFLEAFPRFTSNPKPYTLNPKP
jgi:hypothetical protein